MSRQRKISNFALDDLVRDDKHIYKVDSCEHGHRFYDQIANTGDDEKELFWRHGIVNSVVAGLPRPMDIPHNRVVDCCVCGEVLGWN